MFSRLGVAVAAVVLLTSCAAGGRPAPAGPDVSGTETVSRRFGYHFVVPTGFGTVGATKDWNVGTAPHKNSQPFDTYTALPAGDPWIVVSRRPAPGMSLDQWIAEMTETHTVSYSEQECRPVEDERPATLDGETAVLRGFHCPIDGPQGIAVQLLARHHDDGWVFMCYSEKEAGGLLPPFEQQCQQWAGTFRFGP